MLDAGLICHFGVIMNGSPVILPTAYGRLGDTLYLHGSSANRSIAAADGQQVCVTVTYIYRLVCAWSIFAHSVNYRSAVVFGTAHLVKDHAERLAALHAVAEHLIPGRWDAVREPSRKELAATTVLAVPLSEASVKIRSGPRSMNRPTRPRRRGRALCPSRLLSPRPSPTRNSRPGRQSRHTSPP